MMPAGVADVGSRIASIEARFAPSPGFQATLSQAERGADQQVADTTKATRVASAGSESLGATAVGQALEPAAGAGGSPGWASRAPAAAREWAPAIDRAAREAGIEPELLAAVVQAESGFRPDVTSHAGAIGLAQLMPGTAAGLGVNPHDPQENLAGGARYLREQLDRFGSVELALAAYNAGPNRVAQAGGVPQIAETQSYVVKVRDNYENLR